MRKGILIGGNWIIDQIKVIDLYPTEQALANIKYQYVSNGGCAYNVLKALYRLNANLHLEAVGMIGKDAFGEQILSDCSNMCIDISQLHIAPQSPTSYTDVMSVSSNGRRTFFHYRGANGLLGAEHFDFNKTSCKLFHLGYLLLLDQLDVEDENGITGAAIVLKEAKSKGLITSVDVVSEDSQRFASVIPPALPFVDYLFINEFELSRLTGIKTYELHNIHIQNCILAAKTVIKMGVNKWVIAHYPQGAIAVSSNGEQILQKAINLTKDRIKGTVGAGDAFAAGVLLGLHEDWGVGKSIEMGMASACASLQHATSSEGIINYRECLSMINYYGFKSESQITDGIT